MFYDQIKIPVERIGVLVGKKGETKKKIEGKTSTNIRVTKEGVVTVRSDDNLHVFITAAIIKAIGRGFNPNIAISLWKDNMALEIINIKNLSSGTSKKIKAIKSRIIGTRGKAWKSIENLAKVNISVYGNTVAIIGNSEDVVIAKGAVEKLIRGAPHGNVYKYIEGRMKTVDEKSF